ncbi:hypothetical protein [Bowmanella sp. JS7-9]|uniref:PEP-CTERM protein-sorting domain-containing protein n=1 Tax=Pseudobowmanella zhangzhouensis TaxID=1537679 RepID=A0ABW1XKF9_9ALTE|nr:hypothetical protein [Bowmanella sp. JS7-9]TBX25994.1 hypothetical protein TK45_01930 [Bowmanella sp. JS7-9]
MNVTRNLSFKRTLLLTALFSLGVSPSLQAKLIAKSSGNSDSGNGDSYQVYVVNPTELTGYAPENNQNGILAQSQMLYSAPYFAYEINPIFATPYDDCGPAVWFYDDQGNAVYTSESECAYEFEVGEDILIQGRSLTFDSEAFTTYYNVGILDSNNIVVQTQSYLVENGIFESLFRWDDMMLDPGEYSVFVSLELRADKLENYTKFATIDPIGEISDDNNETFYSVRWLTDVNGTGNRASLFIVPATAASLPVSEPWPLGLWLLPLGLWGLQRRLRR